jgi:hypothetical protein
MVVTVAVAIAQAAIVLAAVATVAAVGVAAATKPGTPGHRPRGGLTPAALALR